MEALPPGLDYLPYSREYKESLLAEPQTVRSQGLPGNEGSHLSEKRYKLILALFSYPRSQSQAVNEGAWWAVPTLHYNNSRSKISLYCCHCGKYLSMYALNFSL